jgi:hypothetical protein
MKVQHHAGISLILAAILFAVFRSLSLSLAALLTGVFIDIDHVVDYLREYGFRFDAGFFFHSFDETLYKRVILLFHGWEWGALLIILSAITNGNPIVAGVTAGFISHLICDQFSNGVNTWGYFFFFRLRNDFIVSKAFPGKGLYSLRRQW